MADEPEPEYPGDPRHPEHEKYLIALGRATYQTALLSGICYDILRVWAGQEGKLLERKDLGSLQRLLREAGQDATRTGLGSTSRFDEFMTALNLARELRNDLLHALPTAHGLQRRGSKVIAGEGNVWTFYTPQRVDTVTDAIALAHRLGNDVLYDDGGAQVEAWYAGQASS